MNDSPQNGQAITLLGGAALPEQALARALARAPRLIAVDGGADSALEAGLVPELAIGDFDSISEQARQRLGPARLLHRPGQDNTDFDKALAHVLAEGTAPFILGLGLSGARLDHTLAGMSTLLRNPTGKLVIDTGTDLCFLCPPRLRISLAPGSRLSLYPMRPLRCASEGLHWPTDGLALDPCGMIGSSNLVSARAVTLRPDQPSLLVLLPVEALDAALAALLAAPPWSGAGA